MRSLHRAVTLAAIAAAGCAGDPAATEHSPPTGAASAHVKDCASQLLTEPAQITVTCADGNLAVADIAWESWAPDSAHGSGTEHFNTCTPNCASGQQQSTPVIVRLSAPEAGVFSRIELTAQDGGAQVYPLPH
ncbi:hypothetical protein BJY24_000935 [Nocardia transvalensis]|uniref:Lipoprotein n=1 Tax=Nocardia transvalensis TaxID=37333 RepID=A0A7W9PA95_9NOCA|nr:hypothetical protein [Nocardia transvalensis]MBB5912068.1 hypothetical protein [Nocardia transvalensis]